MARKGPLATGLEYWAARAVVAALSALPLPAAEWLGRGLGGVWRVLDRRHRERAEAQSAARLGLTDAEAREFVKRNFRHYGMALAEFARLGRMQPEDLRRHIDFGGFEELARGLLAEGRGLVFITAHFGNWEWSNACASVLGMTGGAIARPLDNPRVNEFVRALREKNGLRIFDKQGAIRKALAALRNNEVLGVLIDQDAGRQGLMAPFLGAPASTITIPVELAMRVGSPMLAMALRREPPGVDGGEKRKRFKLVYCPVPRRADPAADPEAETRRLVRQLNADIAEIIMQSPEQWFWIHRRWKSAGRE